MYVVSVCVCRFSNIECIPYVERRERRAVIVAQLSDHTADLYT